MKPVLFVLSNYHPAVGGAENQAARLARACTEIGTPVEILTAAVPGAPRREVVGGIPVHRAIRLVRRPALWGATHFLGTLLFLAARPRRYRLVLCYQLQAFHNPAALLWAGVTRTPVVLRGACSGDFGDLAGMRSMRSGCLLLKFLRHAAAFVALTGEMRDEMAAAGIPLARIAVIPNGVALPAAPAVAAGSRDARDVVFAGRLEPQKGVSVLLEAVASLVAERRQLRLRLFGRGPGEPDLRRRAAELGLERHVLFAGWTDRLGEELGRAGMAVLPTLGEGMSNVLLEALAAGCPVVTTDIPANREVVVDGVSGLLVRPGDAAALAAAMRRILDEAGLAARLEAGGRTRIAEHFDIRAVARRYLDLFAAVRDRRSSPLGKGGARGG